MLLRIVENTWNAKYWTQDRGQDHGKDCGQDRGQDRGHNRDASQDHGNSTKNFVRTN